MELARSRKAFRARRGGGGPLSWASRAAGSWDLVEASTGPAEEGSAWGPRAGVPEPGLTSVEGATVGQETRLSHLASATPSKPAACAPRPLSSGPRGPRPGRSLLRTPGLPVTPSLPFSLGSCTRFQAGQKMPVAPTFRHPRNSDQNLLETHSPPRLWEEETAKEHAQPLHWSSSPFPTCKTPDASWLSSLYPPWKQLVSALLLNSLVLIFIPCTPALPGNF